MRVASRSPVSVFPTPGVPTISTAQRHIDSGFRMISIAWSIVSVCQARSVLKFVMTDSRSLKTYTIERAVVPKISRIKASRPNTE